MRGALAVGTLKPSSVSKRMTRISSFGLYECENCGQIHVKPNYGSVSTHKPRDLFIELTELKKCKGCGVLNEFQNYRYLGPSEKIDTKPPSWVGRLVRFLRNDPYVELDVRRLYPPFDYK